MYVRAYLCINTLTCCIEMTFACTNVTRCFTINMIRYSTLVNLP